LANCDHVTDVISMASMQPTLRRWHFARSPVCCFYH